MRKLRERFVKCHIWSTLLYGCESWNIKNQTRMRLEAFEMKTWRHVLKVSWTHRITNEEILRRMETQRGLLTTMYNFVNYFKAITFCGSHGKKRWIEESMHGWYDEWKKRKRPPKEKLYR